MDQTNQPVAVKQSRWSWGSFMFNPIVILGTKRYYMLFWYLLAFVPILNLFFWIIFGIYMGLNGREMIMKSTAFGSDDERRGFLKGIEHPGFVTFFFFIGVGVIGLVVAFLLSFLAGPMNAVRGMNQNTIQSIPTLPSQY